MSAQDLGESEFELSAIDLLQRAGTVWAKSGEERAQMTLDSHDGDSIPRVTDAGETKTYDGEQVQIMHNGLMVAKGGYQGEWQAKVIEGLKGIHEPQEERVFYEVLKRIKKPGHMIELGAWWSYYSLWYQRVTGGVPVAVEPDPNNIELGQKNAGLNGVKVGKEILFVHAAASDKDGIIRGFKTESSDIIDVVTRSVDSVVKETGIKQLDILHLDIQGFELPALHGALETIRTGKLRFLFVSTHHFVISGSPTTHQDCLSFIEKNGGHIIASHSVYESSSGDGLIVASFDKVDGDFTVEISFEPTGNSLFRTPEFDVKVLWDAHNRAIELLHQKDISIQSLRSDLQAANEQIASLEGSLLQIGGLRNHIKRVAVVRLLGADYGIRRRLHAVGRPKKNNVVSISDDMEVEEIIAALQKSDAENYRNLLPKAPTLPEKIYIMISRLVFKTARKALHIGRR